MKKQTIIGIRSGLYFCCLLICCVTAAGCGKEGTDAETGQANGGQPGPEITGSEQANQEQTGNEQPETGETAEYAEDSPEAQLDYVINAAQIYMNKEGRDVELLSMFGLLYDGTNQMYVDVPALKDMNHLKRSFAYEDVSVLYMKPSDLSDYQGLRIEPGDDFELFCVLTADDGVHIRNYKEEGGVLPADVFAKALLSYNQLHGDVVMPEKNQGEYEAILNGVKQYEGSAGDLSVRHIRHDDVYAFVVASGQNDFSDVRQYLLQKSVNAGWDVVLGELESDPYYRQTVNRLCPDFDITMLPLYSLSDYLGKSPEQTTDKIVQAMAQSGMVVEDADLPVVYDCRGGPFIYLVFTSGKTFLGYFNESGVWDFYAANNYEDALRYMVTLNGEQIVPAYIVPYS